MEEYKFKVGDVVCLKSGGPKMTVVQRVETAEVEMCLCRWFEGSVCHSGLFPASALVGFE